MLESIGKKSGKMMARMERRGDLELLVLEPGDPGHEEAVDSSNRRRERVGQGHQWIATDTLRRAVGEKPLYTVLPGEPGYEEQED